MKNLYIAEKPSVAKEFAKALKENMRNGDGYLEGDSSIVTWCVGHLVSMSYPEAYDESLRRWRFDTIPFLPEEFKYEVIPSSAKQFAIVKGLLNREDVSTIYICTDSGREGEYIYRLVDRMAGVKDKERRRVWIDSQTEEEILRGIREAKDWSAYDNLSNAAYLRAQVDYLMGINFSRVLTLKFGKGVNSFVGREKGSIAVGRVMTCVLGMIVSREREIRSFEKTPFYRVMGTFSFPGEEAGASFSGEWRTSQGSHYEDSPKLYKENGFRKREDAEALIGELQRSPGPCIIESIERKKETKNPPLLYNLAELQNDCARIFKISPEQTLAIAQELYEKKLTTYPRTDARVLSTAVAKEIGKNIGGLKGYGICSQIAAEVLSGDAWKNIAKTRYVNDKLITDHYAIIPTGQGLGNLGSLNPTAAKAYELIVRRFLSIFFPPAKYLKYAVTVQLPTEGHTERFYANFKVLEDEGYLRVAACSFQAKQEEKTEGPGQAPEAQAQDAQLQDAKGTQGEEEEELSGDSAAALLKLLSKAKKGDPLTPEGYEIKEGETKPPKRYNSGSMILAMENAGQLIEDEELRSQIKGSGIGTSATRAEILSKLERDEYISLNKKTQILTPTLLGEMVYDVVYGSITSLLDPSLTASWEKGLSMVADGSIGPEVYREKIDTFVRRHTDHVKNSRIEDRLQQCYRNASRFYKKKTK
ncbi:MAG: type IA DNA topoisomerase [Lachnospiraceae bacterium]|nr:type IA DNA topoisomerase [Lachnospiraceae bacterium]